MLVIIVIWFFHDKLSSKTKPRKLNCDTLSISLLFIEMLISGRVLFLRNSVTVGRLGLWEHRRVGLSYNIY